MVKLVREGTTFGQKDVIELLVEFSSFKDRVNKKFKEIAREFEGKSNEHDLWVNLYLIASDYAEEMQNRKAKQEMLSQKIG
ncbi:hypothetical protein ciss_10030 [Carboxydothermus islandicus]|uniref:Uncharacterized protein n=1 Tax=Carboxydothermus islandicus TaxID=661089 RepID=A0A1L8D1L5_9THEO|nr:hypothetical protein [Carboxydothermus islandicus]GAV25070.1 hypothetical protein ciss_10030 [Carboxydothermus islandicus]